VGVLRDVPRLLLGIRIQAGEAMTDLICAIAVLVLLSSWCVMLWRARIKSNRSVHRMLKVGVWSAHNKETK
jgi:hypothetical protein